VHVFGTRVFAVDDTDVYWGASTIVYTGFGPGMVFSCPKTGCTGMPRTVATVPYGVDSVAVDDDRVYFTGSPGDNQGPGAIFTCPKGGCTTPVTLASALNAPYQLLLDGETVYWIDRGTPAAGYTDGDVASCPKAGCPNGPSFLAKGQSHPGAIATDSACVYWGLVAPGSKGAILRAAK
jgi:hypothetical protein